MTQGSSSNWTFDSKNSQGMDAIDKQNSPSSRPDPAVTAENKNSESCDNGNVQPMLVKELPVFPGGGPCIILWSPIAHFITSSLIRLPFWCHLLPYYILVCTRISYWFVRQFLFHPIPRDCNNYLYTLYVRQLYLFHAMMSLCVGLSICCYFIFMQLVLCSSYSYDRPACALWLLEAVCTCVAVKWSGQFACLNDYAKKGACL